LPLYEYECVKCGHRFERIESTSASAIKKCPQCGARADRLLAAPAIQFKGSGWYVTDYGANAKSSTPAGNGTSESKEGKETKEAKEPKKESKSEPPKTTWKPPVSSVTAPKP